MKELTNQEENFSTQIGLEEEEPLPLLHTMFNLLFLFFFCFPLNKSAGYHWISVLGFILSTVILIKS